MTIRQKAVSKYVEHGFVLTSGTIAEPPPAENQAPIAIASADVYSGKASLLVNFDGSASTDPDGTIATYSWDFMDGNFSNEIYDTWNFSHDDATTYFGKFGYIRLFDYYNSF